MVFLLNKITQSNNLLEKSDKFQKIGKNDDKIPLGVKANSIEEMWKIKRNFDHSKVEFNFSL